MKTVRSSSVVACGIYFFPPIIVIGVFVSNFSMLEGVYNLHKIAVSLLVMMGSLGVSFDNKWLLRMGVVGAWYLFYLILATAIPDEEYYYFNDFQLPDTIFLIFNFGLLTIVFLSTLCLFRIAQKKRKRKIKGSATVLKD